jgi:hypothetical protein
MTGINHAQRSKTIYPVALWLNGSEVIRSFWGFNKTHAFRRAERWGKKHHPNPTTQMPTREQIFDALNGKWFDDDWDSQINLDVATAGQITDAVLALFPQPGPNAEHKPDWSDWGLDHPEEGPNCSCGFNGSFDECAESRASAEPVSIADMAPGTTFDAVANVRGQRRGPFRWRVRSEDTMWSDAQGYGVRPERIDPSTIRDVNPPKGGNRG